MKKIYALTKDQINELPKAVKERVYDTLKAYDEISISYENGRYNYGVSIKSSYAPDHKFIGTAYAEDVYTADERIINYVESFHEFPIQYKGNRDYEMLRKVGYDWDAKFKFDENKNIVRA